MSNAETIYYIKNRYFLLYKKATPKHCTQNYCVILAREQKRGLKNVLNRANVINVRFCSIIYITLVFVIKKVMKIVLVIINCLLCALYIKNI